MRNRQHTKKEIHEMIDHVKATQKWLDENTEVKNIGNGFYKRVLKKRKKNDD